MTYLNILNSIDLSQLNNDNITIAIVGYCIVFIALLSLFWIFSKLPVLLKIELKKRLLSTGKKIPKDESKLEITGEVNAAIAAALFMYFNELHDPESNVLTIKKVSKTYSPWSSNIYGLRHMERETWKHK